MSANQLARDWDGAALERLVRGLPGIAYHCLNDERWTMAFVSEGCRQLTGYGAEEFTGPDGRGFVDLIREDDRGMVRAQVQEAIEDGMPFQCVFRITTASGREKHVWQQGVGICAASGTPEAHQGFIADITEFRRTEEERLRLAEELRLAEKLDSLDALAGGMGHDFNNLLMGILGNAEFALSSLAPDSVVRENLRNIRDAACRAAELTNQMLAYSGERRFELRDVDVNRLIREMQHLLRSSISKKVTVRLELAPELTSIQAEPTQLRQMLMALVRNGAEALRDGIGTVTIGTRLMDCDRAALKDGWLGEHLGEGRHVCVTVADTGCGMDEATRARVFDPFFSTKTRGRGLGLAATLGIVRGHRGAVRVESEPGRGTQFTILFPRPADVARAPGAAPAPAPAAWRGKGSVLVVDDERIVRQVAEWMLKRLGFNVVTAENGEEGVAKFRDMAADIVCVLLDLSMPRMSGEEAFSCIRNLRADVPVLLSSGYDEQAATSGRFANAPRIAFIQKPYELAALEAKVRALIG
jgi:PAS domain S-box-containing protein